MYLEQDGANSACKLMLLLEEKNNGGVISRNGDFNRPPRSCDLIW